MKKTNGWVGVDLDATLAEYHYGDLYNNGNTYIGPPIQTMLDRVKDWISNGVEVRIFTARVAENHPGDVDAIRTAIENWCEIHIGQKLVVTNVKDYSMIELWDDRATGVEPNTGMRLQDLAYRKGYEDATKFYDRTSQETGHGH